MIARRAHLSSFIIDIASRIGFRQFPRCGVQRAVREQKEQDEADVTTLAAAAAGQRDEPALIRNGLVFENSW